MATLHPQNGVSVAVGVCSALPLCIITVLTLVSHIFQIVCVFQWRQNKSQVWHGCCPLPVLPASSHCPAVGRHGHLPVNHSACQPDGGPAGCVCYKRLQTNKQKRKFKKKFCVCVFFR